MRLLPLVDRRAACSPGDAKDRYQNAPRDSVALTRKKSAPPADTESAVIWSGNLQAQLEIRPTGCSSAGLGCLGFLFYCIQMGVCLVLARFLSVTFQRLALRESDFCLALSLSDRGVR